MAYHRDAERARLDAALAAQVDPFTRMTANADDRADEPTRRHRDNLAGARHRAQLHGPPGALIRLLSFEDGPPKQHGAAARPARTRDKRRGRPRPAAGTGHVHAIPAQRRRGVARCRIRRWRSPAACSLAPEISPNRANGRHHVKGLGQEARQGGSPVDRQRPAAGTQAGIRLRPLRGRHRPPRPAGRPQRHRPPGWPAMTAAVAGGVPQNAS